MSEHLSGSFPVRHEDIAALRPAGSSEIFPAIADFGLTPRVTPFSLNKFFTETSKEPIISIGAQQAGFPL